MRPEFVNTIETTLENFRLSLYHMPFSFHIDDWGTVGASVFVYFAAKPDLRVELPKFKRVLKKAGFRVSWYDRYPADHTDKTIKMSVDLISWAGPILNPQL
jgi:hypothetical protein